MYLSRALNRSLAPPDWLSVNLTLRCNLSCTMCTTCYDVPDELSTREIKDLIDQAQAMGVQVFNPLGGELFMRGDLEEILAHAAGAGFYVTITTNGTLINTRRAEMLATIPPSRLHLNISLDGPEDIHDSIRGEGMYRRALKGYHRLREADEAAGNPHRKVLANTIVHRRNLEQLPEFLDHLAELGFDGVQLLNLFRHGKDTPKEGRDLWIRPEDLPRLEPLVETLVGRLNAPRPGFTILNTEQDLRLISRYYTQDLSPLEAPCWAGWKELYINADGQAVMCDGNLDFLSGAFGNVRQQTLRQLWDSPALRERRQVVKTCTTPCIQSCYLRRDSDDPQSLARTALSLAAKAARKRAEKVVQRLRPRATERVDGGVLTLELSDLAPWASPWDPNTLQRWRAFSAGCPTPIEQAWTDEPAWDGLRDRGYLDFGRGFMGRELVQAILDDLRSARLVFPTVQLSWRGEPLLHPEREPILRAVLSAIADDGVFERLQVVTDGRLLGESLQHVLADYAHVPQTWILHGNGMGLEEDVCREHFLAHLSQDRPATQLLAAWTADEDIDPFSVVEPWLERGFDAPVVIGRQPSAGNAIWIRPPRTGHFEQDTVARERLLEWAELLDVTPDLAPLSPPDFSRRRPLTPTVTWDGKLVGSLADVTLRGRLGEVTHQPLSEIWRGLP